MEDTQVTISAALYKDLLSSHKIFCALMAAGVDNWEWYDEAMSRVDEG